MSTAYTEMQLDALRELANIASGTAATSLSQLLGRSIDLGVPKAAALSLAAAIDGAAGASSSGEAGAAARSGQQMTGVALTLGGDIDGGVLLLIDAAGVHTLCALLGVEPGTALGDSAIGEIGNILSASYLAALSTMTGLALVPSPPHVVSDTVAAIVSSALALSVARGESALVLDSELDITGESCAISFMLLPNEGDARALLAPLGLTEAAASR